MTRRTDNRPHIALERVHVLNGLVAHVHDNGQLTEGVNGFLLALGQQLLALGLPAYPPGPFINDPESDMHRIASLDSVQSGLIERDAVNAGWERVLENRDDKVR